MEMTLRERVQFPFRDEFASRSRSLETRKERGFPHSPQRPLLRRFNLMASKSRKKRGSYRFLFGTNNSKLLVGSLPLCRNIQVRGSVVIGCHSTLTSGPCELAYEIAWGRVSDPLVCAEFCFSNSVIRTSTIAAEVPKVGNFALVLI